MSSMRIRPTLMARACGIQVVRINAITLATAEAWDAVGARVWCSFGGSFKVGVIGGICLRCGRRPGAEAGSPAAP